MARSVAVDYFQAYPFWLMDVAPIEFLSLPIFTPLLGFASISSPELTLDVEEIDEANTLFRRKVVKRGSVNTLMMTRAASWYEADFFTWISAALQGFTGGRFGGTVGGIGGVTPRRDLLLIQFLSRSPLPKEVAAVATGALATATVFGANAGGSAGGAVVNLAAQAAVGALLVKLGPAEVAPRIPGRAWMLYDALPVRYKAGSDFDATSSAVSIQELDIAYESFDQISLF